MDEITGIETHQVRRKNRVIFAFLELEREKPLFENAQLVVIGGEFPFNEKHLAQLEGRQITGDSRDCTQIALILHGTMVSFSGFIGLLHDLWTQVGIHMNYQEAFLAFDWGSARLTVR